MSHACRLLALVLAVCAWTADVASAQAALEVRDFVTLPITGLVDGTGQTNAMLARVNTIREEPGGATRLFVVDQNGPIYIVDKTTRTVATYLNLNGREGQTGLFDKLFNDTGYGNGVNGFAFDPDYRRNGRFYTVHIESPPIAGSTIPDKTHAPGLDVASYTTTPAIPIPGPSRTEGVLIEWTDTNVANATFEGTARELMRVALNTTSHPLGDMIFNPTARPGDPDWRALYLECGDGASGESLNLAMRSNPQRLDNFEGKILRIIPDLAAHATTSQVSENGRYRIPNDNPFVARPGARKEIWAYGLRNPHRLTWAVDPEDATNNRLIAASVGYRTWESVYLIHRGANYGYSLREGNQKVELDNTITPLPAVDRIPIQVGATPTAETVAPRYPVLMYSHVVGAPDSGDAIGSGYLYGGNALPALRGKFVVTDIATGRVWWADYKEMLAADDGNPTTMAKMHPVQILWNNPEDSPDRGKVLYENMRPIVEARYQARGGKDPDLPGRSKVILETGRADVRFAVDAKGELYLYSKNDGMIRAVVGATGF